MKRNLRETLRTWGELDFYLANLETLMQIWDDFLHEFKNHPKDPEAHYRYMESLHLATSCVVNKAIEVREVEIGASRADQETGTQYGT